MKKKFFLILSMLLFAAILIFAANKLESKLYSSSNTEKVTADQNEDSKAIESKNANAGHQNDSKDSQEKPVNAKNNPEQPSESKPSDNKSYINNSNSKSNDVVKSTQAAQKVQQQNEKVTPNFIVTNTLNGTKITSQRINFNGKTVGEVTINALNQAGIDYIASGSGSALYISMIGGLRERGAGALSGWVYYVNGNKMNIGAGAYALKDTDVIEWKYVKDGISN